MRTPLNVAPVCGIRSDMLVLQLRSRFRAMQLNTANVKSLNPVSLYLEVQANLSGGLTT